MEVEADDTKHIVYTSFVSMLAVLYIDFIEFAVLTCTLACCLFVNLGAPHFPPEFCYNFQFIVCKNKDCDSHNSAVTTPIVVQCFSHDHDNISEQFQINMESA